MRIYFWIYILIFFTSCTQNGKIAKRDNSKCDYDYLSGIHNGIDTKAWYLINTSKNKKITFTIKRSAKFNGIFQGSSTYTTTLSPGEEQYLGCCTGGKGLDNYNYEIVGRLMN